MCKYRKETLTGPTLGTLNLKYCIFTSHLTNGRQVSSEEELQRPHDRHSHDRRSIQGDARPIATLDFFKPCTLFLLNHWEDGKWQKQEILIQHLCRVIEIL